MIVKKGTAIGKYKTPNDGVFVTDRVMLEIIMGVVAEIEKSRKDREYRF